MPQAQPRNQATNEQARPGVLKLTSPAFADGATIPRRYTADGDDVSPALTWSSPPAGTESFALVCEDPDAPSGLFVHWLVWNINASERGLKEGMLATTEMLDLRQGMNGFGRTGYGGPAPPPGKAHRYVFRLYALDTKPGLRAGADRAQFDRAIEGHVLAQGKLIGLYGR